MQNFVRTPRKLDLKHFALNFLFQIGFYEQAPQLRKRHRSPLPQKRFRLYEEEHREIFRPKKLYYLSKAEVLRWH